MPKYKEANNQIIAFLKANKKTAYADVFSKMLQPDGSPNGRYFFK